MNFDVAPQFERSLKRLRKKFHNIKEDLLRLREILKDHPTAGISLGSGLYKIRLMSSDLKKGTRGGFRIIYFLFISADTIVLIDIYAKNVKESTSVSEARKLLHEYFARKVR